MKYSSFGAGLRLLIQREMRWHLQHASTPRMVVISERETSQSIFAGRARTCTSTFYKVSIRAASQLRLSCLEFPLRLLPILDGVSICLTSCKIEFIRASLDVFSGRTSVGRPLLCGKHMPDHRLCFFF